eukprot:Polyplicarium_translucidae@DN1781_c0_g1_i1.p1
MRKGSSRARRFLPCFVFLFLGVQVIALGLIVSSFHGTWRTQYFNMANGKPMVWRMTFNHLNVGTNCESRLGAEEFYYTCLSVFKRLNAPISRAKEIVCSLQQDNAGLVAPTMYKPYIRSFGNACPAMRRIEQNTNVAFWSTLGAGLMIFAGWLALLRHCYLNFQNPFFYNLAFSLDTVSAVMLLWGLLVYGVGLRYIVPASFDRSYEGVRAALVPSGVGPLGWGWTAALVAFVLEASILPLACVAIPKRLVFRRDSNGGQTDGEKRRRKLRRRKKKRTPSPPGDEEGGAEEQDSLWGIVPEVLQPVFGGTWDAEWLDAVALPGYRFLTDEEISMLAPPGEVEV